MKNASVCWSVFLTYDFIIEIVRNPWKCAKMGGDLKWKGVYYGICQSISCLSHWDALNLLWLWPEAITAYHQLGEQKMCVKARLHRRLLSHIDSIRWSRKSGAPEDDHRSLMPSRLTRSHFSCSTSSCAITQLNCACYHSKNRNIQSNKKSSIFCSHFTLSHSFENHILMSILKFISIFSLLTNHNENKNIFYEWITKILYSFIIHSFFFFGTKQLPNLLSADHT